jgi:hypothetical protein
MIGRWKESFNSVFSNPERRTILLITVSVFAVALIIISRGSIDINRLFYKPEESVLYNTLNFVAIMSLCYAFGFVFSRIQVRIRSGSFRKDGPPPETPEKAKQRGPT